MAKKRYNNEEKAKDFAEKVKGKVNDCRGIATAKSNFTVTYKATEATREHSHARRKKKTFNESVDWAPHEHRDFGYPNSYWKD